MSMAFSDEQIIAAPIGTVWATLTNWDHGPKWLPGVDSMHSSGPLAEGTSLVFTARGKERTSRITECRPDTALTLVSAVGGVLASYRYTLEALEPATTRAALVVDVATSGFMRLLGGVIRTAIAKEDHVQLLRLKHLVEQSSECS